MQPGESLISPEPGVGQRRLLRGDGDRARRRALLRRRDDADGAAACSSIDERLARRFWPDRTPSASGCTRPRTPSDLLAKPAEEQMLTVVGVVENVRHRGLVDCAGHRPRRRLLHPVASAARAHAGAGGAHRAGTRDRDRVPCAGRSRRSIPSCRSTACARWRSGCRRRWSIGARRCCWPSALRRSRCCSRRSGSTACWRIRCRSARREIGIRMALGADDGSIFGMVLARRRG